MLRTKKVVVILAFAPLFAGKMLGDGYMGLTRSKPRFSFIHSLKDKDYADYCYVLFSKYLPYGTGINPVGSVFDKRTQKRYYRVFYQSRTAALLEPLYQIWYNGKCKVIPFKWIDKYLDTTGLALWFQDDGSLKNNGNRIILSTEAFTPEERIFLQWMLRIKFNISASIDSQNRLDISSRHEVRKFQALVEPLIHSSMARKSIKHKWKEWQDNWQLRKQKNQGISRTSLYLPYEMQDVLARGRF